MPGVHKEAWSWMLQVCLSMYDLLVLVGTRHERVKSKHLKLEVNVYSVSWKSKTQN